MLAVEQSLVAEGHVVAVFSMRHPQNLDSPWQDYWPDNVEFGERLGSVASAKAAVRSAYSWDVARRLLTLVKRFRPDVAHLHSIHHHLTVSVLDALWRAGVPAVWTLHDYRVVCPATHLLRDGRPCSLCAGGRYWNCPVHRCKASSRMRSLAVSAESSLSAVRGVYRRRVTQFIAPSEFLAGTVVRMGIPDKKVTVIPSPLAARDWNPVVGAVRHGALYVGRLSREKGVDALVRAHSRACLGELRIIGDGPDAERLRRLAVDLGSAVKFEGWLDRNGVREALSSAAVLCVPSICFENCPSIVLEAFAVGTPVLASELGGLTELLDGGRCGVLLPPGHEQAWAEAMLGALSQPEELADRAAAGRKRVLERHSPSGYMQRLEAVYGSAISNADCRRPRI